jgi:Domain of unknown function (DUF4166)
MPPLYNRVLGNTFTHLPTTVRALHTVDTQTRWSGAADVQRGNNPICRLIATLTRLPPSGANQPLSVTFTPDQLGAETWTRQFGTAAFVSVQSADGDIIREQIGPVTLFLRPTATREQLTLALEHVLIFGLHLPKRLHPTIATREYQNDARYQFEVEASLPGLGLLVRYAGWLTPAIKP